VVTVADNSRVALCERAFVRADIARSAPRERKRIAGGWKGEVFEASASVGQVAAFARSLDLGERLAGLGNDHAIAPIDTVDVTLALRSGLAAVRPRSHRVEGDRLERLAGRRGSSAPALIHCATGARAVAAHAVRVRGAAGEDQDC